MAVADVEDKLRRHGCQGFLLYLGLCLLNGCFVFLQLAFKPVDHGTVPEAGHEFSYIVGGTCDDVSGKLDLVGMPDSVIQCTRVFIEQSAQEALRDFMDVYIASLLFSTYLLHQLPQMILQAEGFKRLSEIMFVFACVVESIALLAATIGVHVMWWNGDYVSSDPKTILDEYNPYRGVYNGLLWASCLMRGGNWIGVGVVIILDRGGRMREWSTSFSALMHNERLHRCVSYAYMYCFIVVMNVDMLLALYFYQRNNLPATDFSYIVGADCDGVAGINAAQFEALDTPTKTCVWEYIMTLDWQVRIPSFMLCYLTVALFYVLIIVEALDYFTDDTRKRRAQLFTGAVLLFEAVGFMILVVLVTALAEPDLQDNDATADLQRVYCGIMVWARVVAMLIFYYMKYLDRKHRAEDDVAVESQEESKLKEAEEKQEVLEDGAETIVNVTEQPKNVSSVVSEDGTETIVNVTERPGIVLSVAL